MTPPPAAGEDRRRRIRRRRSVDRLKTRARAAARAQGQDVYYRCRVTEPTTRAAQDAADPPLLSDPPLPRD